MLIALTAALARPMISTSSSRQSIVYAVDVSYSVSSASIQAAAGKIDNFNSALRPSHSRIVAFGMTAAVLDGTSALRQLAQIESRSPGATTVDRSGTDIEAALDAGRAELATGYVPRIVLFSDGRATAGEMDAAIAKLIDAHVPVSVEPLAPRSIGDTWIDSLELPDRIPAGAAFTATVSVGSQREGQAVIELRSAGTIVGTRSIAISSGTTVVPINAVLEAPGAYVLQAVVKIPNDPLAENNTLDRGVWADPPHEGALCRGHTQRAPGISRAH